MQDVYHLKHNIPAFRTKVVVTGDSIKVEGEGAPNVVGLFKGASEDASSINRYDCDLGGLPVIILQQVKVKLLLFIKLLKFYLPYFKLGSESALVRASTFLLHFPFFKYLQSHHLSSAIMLLQKEKCP